MSELYEMLGWEKVYLAEVDTKAREKRAAFDLRRNSKAIENGS